MKEVTVEKSNTGSFTERTASVADGIAGFAKSPWLGQGWASINSWDLLFSLLANVGVIGTAAFGGFVLSLLLPTLSIAIARPLGPARGARVVEGLGSPLPWR